MISDLVLIGVRLRCLEAASRLDRSMLPGAEHGVISVADTYERHVLRDIDAGTGQPPAIEPPPPRPRSAIDDDEIPF